MGASAELTFEELERVYKVAKAYRYMYKGDYGNYDKSKALAFYKKAFDLQPENHELKFW